MWLKKVSNNAKNNNPFMRFGSLVTKIDIKDENLVAASTSGVT